jgi:hypothetical protein
MFEIIASLKLWMYIYKQPRPPIVVGALAALAPKNARPPILRRKIQSIIKINNNKDAAQDADFRNHLRLQSTTSSSNDVGLQKNVPS